MGTDRINARLDQQAAEDLEFIRSATGASTVTEALKYSLHEVASRLRQPEHRGTKLKAFLASNYIGSFDSGEDVSENYKDMLFQGWTEKHDLD